MLSQSIIRPYTADDQPALVALLANSFAADPSFTSLVQLAPGQDMVTILRHFFRAQLESWWPESLEIEVCVNSKHLLGATLWVPPQVELAPEPVVAAFQRWEEASSQAGGIIAEWITSPHTFHPPFPHWYFYIIAVSAKARGQSVGSRLLNHGIRRAQTAGLYLEATTPRAAKLYERKGFVPLGIIPGSQDGGAGEIAMWHPPLHLVNLRDADHD